MKTEKRMHPSYHHCSLQANEDNRKHEKGDKNHSCVCIYKVTDILISSLQDISQE